MSNSLFPPKWKENTKGAKKQLGVIRKKADEGDVTEEVRKLDPFIDPSFLERLEYNIRKETGYNELLIPERCLKAREKLKEILEGKCEKMCIHLAKHSFESFLEEYEGSLKKMGTNEEELRNLIEKGKLSETQKVK